MSGKAISVSILHSSLTFVLAALETYELAPGGRQLIVTLTSQDRRLKQPLVIRRVYDAAARDAD